MDYHLSLQFSQLLVLYLQSRLPLKCKNRFTGLAIVFLFDNLSPYLLLPLMARTSQLENLSKNKLIDEVLSLENF